MKIFLGYKRVGFESQPQLCTGSLAFIIRYRDYRISPIEDTCHEKMYIWASAPNENSHESAHPRSLTGVFTVRLMKPWLS